MSDLSVNVNWQEIIREKNISEIPHCRAIAAPQKWHLEIIESLSKIILNKSEIENNPDLLIIGTVEKAPVIESCRNLIQEIALKPVNSNCRLGVILSADKLLLPAANSLLKLAEEPPSHAYLLFLMEDARFFLPTLKSRSRFHVLVSNDKAELKAIPENEFEWVEWLAKTRKNDIDFIINELESWVSWALSERDFELSNKIEKLRVIASERNLSVQMLTDVIILILKDGFNSESELFAV